MSPLLNADVLSFSILPLKITHPVSFMAIVPVTKPNVLADVESPLLLANFTAGSFDCVPDVENATTLPLVKTTPDSLCTFTITTVAVSFPNLPFFELPPPTLSLIAYLVPPIK